jgi:hypothetical protein
MTQAGPVHITDLSTTRSNLVPPSHFTRRRVSLRSPCGRMYRLDLRPESNSYEYKPQFWFQPVLRPIADL